MSAMRWLPRTKSQVRQKSSSTFSELTRSADRINPKLKRWDQRWETDGYCYDFSLLGCSSHYINEDLLTDTGPELLLLILHYKTPQRTWGERDIINWKGTNHSCFPPSAEVQMSPAGYCGLFSWPRPNGAWEEFQSVSGWAFTDGTASRRCSWKGGLRRCSFSHPQDSRAEFRTNREKIRTKHAHTVTWWANPEIYFILELFYAGCSEISQTI